MRKVLFLLAALLFCQLMPVSAQVSLGTANQTDVVVTVNGEEQSFTILKDYKKPDHFYFVPNKPQLATRRHITGKTMPVFHLLKYQTKNESTNDLVDGGILQFAIKLTPDASVVKEMRKKIAEQFSIDEKTLKLSPLPFKTAEVTIYNLDGEMIATEFQKPGIAPSFANSEIPFQVQLTSLSADVYQALTTGGGGIPLYITYTFDQISAPTGFKVTANWNQLYEHFSQDTKTKQAFTQWYYYRTWWGGWRTGAKTGVQETHNQTLSEILQEKKSIIVDSVASEKFTQKEIDTLMNPVIERIQKELIEKITPPEKIEPAAAKEPANPGWWRTSTNVSMKNFSKVKKGEETFEFNRQDIFESKSTFGSVLGIGNYDDQIKKMLITIKPAGNWDYSFFTVPSVGDSQSLGIQKISMQVVPKYLDAKGKLQPIPGTVAELAEWKWENGYFANRKGQEINNILFPMQAITDGLSKKGISLENCKYDVTLTVTQGSNIMKFNSQEDFLMGGVPVTTPLARIEGVEIDCETGLEFGDKSDKESLAAVQIKVSSDFPKKVYNLIIKSNSENKNPVFLVEKEDEGKKNKVTTVINFLKFNGKKVAWKHNGRNLRDDDLGLSVILWETDWNPESEN